MEEDLYLEVAEHGLAAWGLVHVCSRSCVVGPRSWPGYRLGVCRMGFPAVLELLLFLLPMKRTTTSACCTCAASPSAVVVQTSAVALSFGRHMEKWCDCAQRRALRRALAQVLQYSPSSPPNGQHWRRRAQTITNVRLLREAGQPHAWLHSDVCTSRACAHPLF